LPSIGVSDDIFFVLSADVFAVALAKEKALAKEEARRAK
jgi:hypothetical protein